MSLSNQIADVFAKSFAAVAAFIYLVGILGFVISLATDFPLSEMPPVAHGVVLFCTIYGAFGFIIFRRRIVVSSGWIRFFYLLITAHLLISALLHAYSLYFHSNNWIDVFPPWYQFLGMLYFAFFALLCVQIRLE